MEANQATPNVNQYVGFWKRFLALFLDSVVLYMVGYFLIGPVITQEGGRTVTTVNFSGLNALIPILYYYLSWTFISASPAGWVLGTKIIKTDGTKLTWDKALLRLIATIPCFLIACVGFFWIGFTKEKQGWHDLIAKTYVVKR